MQKNILFGIGGLLIGLSIGFFVANSINRSAVSPQTVAQNQPSVPSAAQAIPSAQTNANGGAVLPDVAETLDKAKSDPNSFEAQMKAGDLYAQIGRFDQAIPFYEAGVKLKPNDFQANVVLGNSYFDAKQFENAEKYYAQALEINPQDINARTDLGTTFVERADPNYERAIKEFQSALKVNPKHEPTLYNLGVAYARQGQAENAQKVVTQLEEANPNSQLITKLRQAISAK